MKTKNNSAKLKGTVLYTVVSVLMVLIVFLMGTLALAATASNRAYTNYQKEQTEYTARAVLDAVMQKINEDVAGTGLKGDIAGMSGSTTITVGISDGTNVREYDVVVRKTDRTTSVYSAEDEEWSEVAIYELSVNVGSNTTSAETTYTSFIGADVISTSGGGGGGAFVSLGDTGGQEIATKGYTTGGSFLGIGVENFEYSMSSNGTTTIDAPFYVNGDLGLATDFIIHYTNPGDFFVVKGDLNLTNGKSLSTSHVSYSAPANIAYNQTPYLYVEGTLNSVVGSTVGAEDTPVNLYCGSFSNKDGNGNQKWYGDIYAFNADGTSYISNQGTTTALYEWTNNLLTKNDGSETKFGNYYSAGNVEFDIRKDGTGIEGDLRVAKDIKIAGGGNWNALVVGGDVMCGGTLTIGAGQVLKCDGDIYAANLINNGRIECSGTINVLSAPVAGDLNGNTLTMMPTEGLPPQNTTTTTITTTSWYDNFADAVNGLNAGDSYPYYYKYTYNEYVKVVEEITENGVTTTNETLTTTPVSVTVHETWWIDTNSTTYQDVLNADANYQAVPAFIAGAGEANAVVNTATTTMSTYSMTKVNGSSIYPDDFTYEAFNDEDYEHYNAILVEPNLADYDQYPRSINALDTSLYDNGYEVPVYSKGGTLTYTANEGVINADNAKTPPEDADADFEAGLDAGDYYEVTTDCVLTGYFNKPIYINADQPITVILDNVKLQQIGDTCGTIVVNDEKAVTLFVVGTVEVGSGGNGWSIVTEDYLNIFMGEGAWSFTNKDIGTPASKMAADITIHQNASDYPDEYPNLVIYSDDNATLDVKEGGMITALVRAPELIFKGGKGPAANKTIHYELPNGNATDYGANADINHENNTIGLIGQLVAGSIQLTSNGSWGMLYVTLDDGCACGCPTCDGSATCTCCDGGSSCCETCICDEGSGAGASGIKSFDVLYYNIY